jgi:hypothetical protein
MLIHEIRFANLAFSEAFQQFLGTKQDEGEKLTEYAK